VWGNVRLSAGLPEDEFIVEIITYDSTRDDAIGFHSQSRFITFGPLVFEEYFFHASAMSPDIIPNPDEWLQLKILLRNESSAATATNIKAVVNSLDPSISFTSSTYFFENIPAGVSKPSNNVCNIIFSKDCPVDTMIPLEVEIYSYDQVCWRDTFSMVVHPFGTSVNDIKSSIIKIYPNPTNDLLTIETSQAGQLLIEITSLNGKLLYSNRMEEPIHQIDLSSFEKGLYFVSIRSRDFVRTEKIIKQ
jgi:hypothetical protein